MWVPALAGTPSGEVGHPAYQHPQRLREGAYSREVDRFPLLVIYVALRCLVIGGRQLWDRFDNGDNLLFRQQDFEAPGQSPLYSELLLMNHPEVRELTAKLIDAARMPLEQTVLLRDLVAVEAPPAQAQRQWPTERSSSTAGLAPSSARGTNAAAEHAPVAHMRRRRQRSMRLLVWMSTVAVVGIIASILLWGLRRAAHPRSRPSIRRWSNRVMCSTPRTQIMTRRRSQRRRRKSRGPRPNSPLVTQQVEYPVSRSLRMVFCWIPTGEARLGSPRGEATRISHEVERSFSTMGFWLGKYEVTQAEWAAVMGINPSVHDGDKPGRVARMDTSRFPVEDVTWKDVQMYIKALNNRSGGDDVFGVPGDFTLPSEDEWEYACRGGHGNAEPFYFGGVLNGRQANCDGTKPYGTMVQGPRLGRPTSVGSYASEYQQPWGLCDMHGNVWEFCESERPRPAGTRVLRGGCWGGPGNECRAANRNFFGPDTNHYMNLGFRVCFRPKVAKRENSGRRQ